MSLILVSTSKMENRTTRFTWGSMEEALTRRNREKNKLRTSHCRRNILKQPRFRMWKWSTVVSRGPRSLQFWIISLVFFFPQERNLYPLNLSLHTGLLLSLEGTKRNQIESRVPKGPCGSSQEREKKRKLGVWENKAASGKIKRRCLNGNRN